MAETNDFKVIIAGGSIIGLTLANALERAGIDYLLLEKRQIAPNLGASISLLSHNSRVYEQLGVIDQFNAATVPLLNRLHFTQDGYLFEDGGVLRGLSRSFRFMERRFHLETLYNNLQDKSKVHSNVGVQSFEENASGVTVFATNGERYEGSILVGADGAHSTIRQLLSEAVADTDPVRAENLRSPFTASYRSIFATSRNTNLGTQRPFMPDGTVNVAYHRGVSGVAASGVEGLVFWFLFVKNDEITRTPDCPRYSEKDAEAAIEQFGHLNLGADYTFRDLWNSKTLAAMFPMEEGVLKAPWNNGGRVVLLGDSVSKTTVNAGIGGNTHVEGVCHFMNGLVGLVKQNHAPSTKEITEMFNGYETKQRPRSELILKLSAFVTRYEAMETWWLRLLMPVMRLLPDGLVSTLLGKHFAAAPLFDFLPKPNP
ncbi:hypothetical protein EKO27_g1044 [Xylaria grammica]|uniref:FAD-binding domain-containing protein n=1 Tax=Xylaria grammica TaxID=363999 RepID=A0A439DI50_9PEZI|nr:hypothetical protein EKO27_g1044 [Xylaria grammica]